MPRTPAQNQAIERDAQKTGGPYCLWSMYGAPYASLVPGTDSHHLARRQPGADLPELCLTLGHAVHMHHHAGLGPTTSQLLDLMAALYGFDLRADFPAFFGRY